MAEIKFNQDYTLLLSKDELLALEKLLGALTTKQCLELGLSYSEDTLIYNIYRALPEHDDLIGDL